MGPGETQGDSPFPPPPPPPPLPTRGVSKGLDMWKKKQAELTEPGDQTADVIDREDQPTPAPGTSYDPKGRNTRSYPEDFYSPGWILDTRCRHLHFIFSFGLLILFVILFFLFFILCDEFVYYVWFR